MTFNIDLWNYGNFKYENLPAYEKLFQIKVLVACRAIFNCQSSNYTGGQKHVGIRL